MFDISRNTFEYIELDSYYSIQPTYLSSTVEDSIKGINSPVCRPRNNDYRAIRGESSPHADPAASQQKTAGV